MADTLLIVLGYIFALQHGRKMILVHTYMLWYMRNSMEPFTMK